MYLLYHDICDVNLGVSLKGLSTTFDTKKNEPELQGNNNHMTSRRELKQGNLLSLPQRDDYKTRKDTK